MYHKFDSILKNYGALIMDEKKCFNCESTENDVPVIDLRCQGKEIWICPQCLPNLIHNPQKVQETLLKALES